MTIEQQENYIRQFVAQGVPLEKCYNLIMADEASIAKIKSNTEFMAEMNECQTELTLEHITTYNDKVEISVAPSDHLKRLEVIAPDIFKETPSVLLTGDLVINKVRDEKKSD